MHAVRKRILAQVIMDESTGCWFWCGSTGRNGYGKIEVDGVTTTAHRASFVAFVEPVDDSKEIDHLCRHRLCVNPTHLEPVTHTENMRRAVAFSGRSDTEQCKDGHPLDGSRTRDGGGRYCKTCVKLSKRRQRAANK